MVGTEDVEMLKMWFSFSRSRVTSVRRDPSERISRCLPGGENKSRGAAGSTGGPGREDGAWEAG